MTPHQEASRSAAIGLGYGVAAYGLWGLIPLYFRAVRSVGPLEILAHRVVWSVVFLALLLTALSRWRELGRCLGSARVAGALGLSTLLIAGNWYVFIYAAVSGKVVLASLGYYILPLVNVLLGLVVFRERLRPAQWVAVALAAVGVSLLVARAGEFPWIALTLAVSFSLYGLVRKQVPVAGVVGLMVETLFLLPAAIVVLCVIEPVGGSAFGRDATLSGLLALGGVVTAVPLICFAQAVRRLRLTTVGFLQYLSPSVQFVLAVTLFDEAFTVEMLTSFLFIWAAVAVFVVQAAFTSTTAPPSHIDPAPLPD